MPKIITRKTAKTKKNITRKSYKGGTDEEPTKEQVKFFTKYLKDGYGKSDKLTKKRAKYILQNALKSNKRPINKTLSVKEKIQKCHDTYIKYKDDVTKDNRAHMQKFAKEEYKNLSKLKTKITPKQLNFYMEFLKAITGSHDKKMLKITNDMIKKTNCNIGCKGTLLEPGPANKLPKSLTNSPLYKKYPEFIKLLQSDRTEVFGSKTNVLDEDSFYENIKPQIKKKLMRLGAVSYCHTAVPDDL